MKVKHILTVGYHRLIISRRVRKTVRRALWVLGAFLAVLIMVGPVLTPKGGSRNCLGERLFFDGKRMAVSLARKTRAIVHALVNALSGRDLLRTTAAPSQVLRLPFTSGFWVIQTYDRHSTIGYEGAADFWWASPQRPDTYSFDRESSRGKTIRAAHDGRVFIFAFDITALDPNCSKSPPRSVCPKGDAARIRYEPNMSDRSKDRIIGLDTRQVTIPTTTFVLEADKTGALRVIDLELVVLDMAKQIATLYVHLKIDESFFRTTEVLNGIKDAVRQIFEKTDPGTAQGQTARVAIDTKRNVGQTDTIGSVAKFGLANAPHLHFRLHLDTSFGPENPFLGEPSPLDDDGNIRIGDDVVMPARFQWRPFSECGSGWIYQYPAIPHDRVQPGSRIVVRAEEASVWDKPGGTIVGEVRSGTLGQVLEGPEAKNSNGEECKDETTCFVWYKLEYPTLSGWTASPFLSHTTIPGPGH